VGEDGRSRWGHDHSGGRTGRARTRRREADCAAPRRRRGLGRVGRRPYTLFFSSTINFKVWFATLVLVLAAVQLLTALRLYGKITIPRSLPAWWADAHRLSGTLAFLVSLPVAYQCLWGLGYQTTTTRIAVHSALGCAFYGAFVVKVLAVRVRGLPDWALPIAGGLTFVILVAVWCTSSLWFITSRPAGVPLF
jgi:hypothetical protein